MKSIYSKEILEKVVKNCTTYADALIVLGRKPRGSNYETIKKYIKKYNLDVSHFDEGLSKIKKSNRKRVKTEDVLNNVYYIGSDNLKKRLINENLKEYKCEKCGNNEWNNQPIPLELHHINGNSYDNRLENLQLLCPNCHAQTNNYRGKNSSNKDEKYTITRRFIANIEEKTCLNCGKTFLPERKTRKFCCRQCYDEYMSKNNENIITLSSLKDAMEKYSTMSDLGKFFNVTRTTIRNYLIKYGLLDELKDKYDFHAKEIIQLSLSGEVIKVWPSIKDAEETLNICQIGKCASHKRKSAGGFIWRYKN